MVHATHVDLPCRVFGQVVHDVVAYVFDRSVAAERYATDRIHSDVVKQRHGHSISDVFEYFLREGWTVRVCIDFRVWIRHRRLLLDVALALD